MEEELSIIATQTWAEGVWIGKWCTEQKDDEGQVRVDMRYVFPKDVKKMLLKQVSAKDAAKKRERRSTGCITAQAGTKSDVGSQRLSESGSRKQEPQRRSGIGKEVL